MTRTDALLDRRRFLQLGAAGVAATTLGLTSRAGLSAAEAKKDDRFAGFKLGAQSYTFRNFDREQALTRIKDAGLHYVEFYQKHAPLESSPDQIKAILKLCKEYDITPVTYGVQHFSKNTDANRKVFEFGKAMGLKVFSADPEPDAFDSLDKLCEEYKIAIGIHPHGPTGPKKLHRWYSAEIIWEAVKDHHPLIGSCLDTGHLIRCAQLGKMLDPAQQIRKMGPRNFGIHLKDHDNEKHTDVVCGKAVLNVGEVLKALKEVKFSQLISIEYEANPKEPTADVKACVAVVAGAAQKLG